MPGDPTCSKMKAPLTARPRVPAWLCLLPSEAYEQIGGHWGSLPRVLVTPSTPTLVSGNSELWTTWRTSLLLLLPYTENVHAGARAADSDLHTQARQAAPGTPSSCRICGIF